MSATGWFRPSQMPMMMPKAPRINQIVFARRHPTASAGTDAVRYARYQCHRPLKRSPAMPLSFWHWRRPPLDESAASVQVAHNGFLSRRRRDSRLAGGGDLFAVGTQSAAYNHRHRRGSAPQPPRLLAPTPTAAIPPVACNATGRMNVEPPGVKRSSMLIESPWIEVVTDNRGVKKVEKSAARIWWSYRLWFWRIPRGFLPMSEPISPHPAGKSGHVVRPLRAEAPIGRVGGGDVAFIHNHPLS